MPKKKKLTRRQTLIKVTKAFNAVYDLWLDKKTQFGSDVPISENKLDDMLKTLKNSIGRMARK